MCNDLLYNKWSKIYKITQTTIYADFGLNYLSKKFHFKAINEAISLDIKKQSIIGFPNNIPKNSIYNFISIKLHIYGSIQNHFNIIIINYAFKTIERFEPHGYDNIVDTQYVIPLLLQKYFHKILPNFIFIPNFNIRQSLQILHKDTEGLCQTYGLYYLYKRLTNLHIVDRINFESILINTSINKNIKQFSIKILCEIFKKLDKNSQKLLLDYNNLNSNDKILLMMNIHLLNY
jgi:hypothetical protein